MKFEFILRHESQSIFSTSILILQAHTQEFFGTAQSWCFPKKELITGIIQAGRTLP